VTALAVIAGVLLAQATPGAPVPPSLRVAPVVRQGFVYFVSDRVTAAGAGGGAGVQAVWAERWLAQADAALLWGGGNVWVTRFAAGVQRPGGWTPALWLSFATLWGDRVAVLDEAGRLPAAPTWATGVRISPLRFTGRFGSVSALDVGWSRGTGGGTWIEGSILEAVLRW
jgi:hypothetical protein